MAGGCQLRVQMVRIIALMALCQWSSAENRSRQLCEEENQAQKLRGCEDVELAV